MRGDMASHDTCVYATFRAAWKEVGHLPADEAKLQYIGLVKSACPDFQEAEAGKPKSGGPGGPVFSSLADGPEDSQTGPVSTHVPPPFSHWRSAAFGL